MITHDAVVQLNRLSKPLYGGTQNQCICCLSTVIICIILYLQVYICYATKRSVQAHANPLCQIRKREKTKGEKATYKQNDQIDFNPYDN